MRNNDTQLQIKTKKKKGEEVEDIWIGRETDLIDDDERGSG